MVAHMWSIDLRVGCAKRTSVQLTQVRVEHRRFSQNILGTLLGPEGTDVLSGLASNS
jgi:hypothetical protein